MKKNKALEINLNSLGQDLTIISYFNMPDSYSAQYLADSKNELVRPYILSEKISLDDMMLYVEYGVPVEKDKLWIPGAELKYYQYPYVKEKKEFIDEMEAQKEYTERHHHIVYEPKDIDSRCVYPSNDDVALFSDTYDKIVWMLQDNAVLQAFCDRLPRTKKGTIPARRHFRIVDDKYRILEPKAIYRGMHEVWFAAGFDLYFDVDNVCYIRFGSKYAALSDLFSYEHGEDENGQPYFNIAFVPQKNEISFDEFINIYEPLASSDWATAKAKLHKDPIEDIVEFKSPEEMAPFWDLVPVNKQEIWKYYNSYCTKEEVDSLYDPFLGNCVYHFRGFVGEIKRFRDRFGGVVTATKRKGLADLALTYEKAKDPENGFVTMVSEYPFLRAIGYGIYSRYVACVLISESGDDSISMIEPSSKRTTDDCTISGAVSDPAASPRYNWKRDDDTMYFIEFDGVLYGAKWKKK